MNIEGITDGWTPGCAPGSNMKWVDLFLVRINVILTDVHFQFHIMT